MKIIPLILAILLAACLTTKGEIRITNDPGGRLDEYVVKVERAFASGERIVIDGSCRSACTLYLLLPRDQICATPRGTFVFHSAVDSQFGLPMPEKNDALLKAYPPKVRYYVLERGGLWLTPITAKATLFVRAC